MSNTPSNAEAWDLWLESITGGHHPASLAKFARAVLAKWGTQPQAGAVPQGWKAVPVNPTPEMWKAAKSVPDPNPPYPPHYGLVWDAMLAASPTPPVEQAAPKAAPGEPDKLMRDCLALLESFDYEDDEDSQSKAFFNAHINADWFFHVKRSIERQLEAKAAPMELNESAYQRGYLDGMAKGRREVEAAPQPAPAPLSESIDQVERALAIIGVVGTIDGHDVVRRESVLEIARRAALAAQGDTP